MSKLYNLIKNKQIKTKTNPFLVSLRILVILAGLMIFFLSCCLTVCFDSNNSRLDTVQCWGPTTVQFPQWPESCLTPPGWRTTSRWTGSTAEISLTFNLLKLQSSGGTSWSSTVTSPRVSVEGEILYTLTNSIWLVICSILRNSPSVQRLTWSWTGTCQYSN